MWNQIIETLRQPNLLQLFLLAAVALPIAYWALGAGIRFARRTALVAALLLVALLALRLLFPESVCAISWPSPLARLCV